MQQLWARVLAGEANAPGTFSKRTVNLLADLDRSDAELFVRLCGFGWMIGDVVPLVFDVQADVYNKHGIHFKSLAYLESLGLVQFNNLAGFSHLRLPKAVTVFYYGQPTNLTFPTDQDNELQLGKVLLTRAGQQLAPVCESTPIEGYYEYIYDRWAEQSLVPKREIEHSAAGDAPTAGG